MTRSGHRTRRSVNSTPPHTPQLSAFVGSSIAKGLLRLTLWTTTPKSAHRSTFRCGDRLRRPKYPSGLRRTIALTGRAFQECSSSRGGTARRFLSPISVARAAANTNLAQIACARAAHSAKRVAFVLPSRCKPEGWPSGRRRTPGKCVYGKPYRGFESRPLRQNPMEIVAFSSLSY
jgi:hypothetical protein